jgi:hypothetical protein
MDDLDNLKHIKVIDEPYEDITKKWIGFVVTFMVMLLVLIYLSSYFARGTGKYIHKNHERGISVLDKYDSEEPEED